MKKVIGIILAAGKGTRLNHGKPSEIPKVLHLLYGRPLVSYCIDTLKGAGVKDIVLVIGYKGHLVKKVVGKDVIYVSQEKQLGTANAVFVARDSVSGKSDYVVVLNGDNPLFSKETISNLVNRCEEKNTAVSLVSVDLKDPSGYGRIIKDKEDNVLEIIEEKDVSQTEEKVKEVNAGCYCFKSSWLWDNLRKVKLNPHGEYYLTDLVGIAVESGDKAVVLKIEDEKEAIGINTKENLEKAHKAVNRP